MATQIEVIYDNDGYMRIEAKGHTQSVVCASVSTLLQSSVRYLQELAAQYPTELQVTIKPKCEHDFFGVSYGNGPIKECRICGLQLPFE